MSEASGLNLRLGFAIAAGAIGSSFQHGWATGVVNCPQWFVMSWIRGCNASLPDVKSFDNNSSLESSSTIGIHESGNVADPDNIYSTCRMTQAEVTGIFSIVVSIFCVGGIVGGCSVGLLSSKLGRRGGLLFNNIFMLLGGLLMLGSKYADSYEMLIAGRFFIGVNAGISAGISPMYLTEISPTNLRGAVGTFYQLIMTMSILLSQIIGMEGVLGNEYGWSILFALTIVPGLFQLVTLPFCPESPKFLLLDRGDEGRALNALSWLRGRDDLQAEMIEMKMEQQRMKMTPHINFKEMFTNPELRAPLFIALMMMLAQQLSGINAAIFFSTKIFEEAGLSSQSAQSATLGMGGMNVAMTFISLVMIEKAGRKTLMLSGLVIMLISTTSLLACLLVTSSVASYLSIVFVIMFVVGFATGPGSIPWFFVNELFQQSARPMAASMAVATNWAANYVVAQSFPIAQFAIGSYVFIAFIVTQVVFIAYVWFKVPETKNKTIDEIFAQFQRN